MTEKLNDVHRSSPEKTKETIQVLLRGLKGESLREIYGERGYSSEDVAIYIMSQILESNDLNKRPISSDVASLVRRSQNYLASNPMGQKGLINKVKDWATKHHPNESRLLARFIIDSLIVSEKFIIVGNWRDSINKTLSTDKRGKKEWSIDG